MSQSDNRKDKGQDHAGCLKFGIDSDSVANFDNKVFSIVAHCCVEFTVESTTGCVIVKHSGLDAV